MSDLYIFGEAVLHVMSREGTAVECCCQPVHAVGTRVAAIFSLNSPESLAQVPVETGFTFLSIRDQTVYEALKSLSHLCYEGGSHGVVRYDVW